MHVLFVCTGNICRSPTAERLAAAYTDSHRIPNLAFSSAGTHAVISHPIYREAASVLEELGGRASDFAARQLTSKIASSADLVITMEAAHRDKVLELAPRLLRRTFTLTEAALLSGHPEVTSVADWPRVRPQIGHAGIANVPDPIGQPREVFVAVGSQIAELLGPVLEMVARTSE